MESNYHAPVLLNETITLLDLKPNSIVVDMTLGRAGHSSEILKKIPFGYLYGVDRDQTALEFSKQRLSKIGNNFTLIHSNFSDAVDELKKIGVTHVDAILYDLGVSSPQFDNPERGFSYRFDAPLDMRMDRDKEFSAYDVVNTYSYNDLVRILREYGEEKYASSIANNIIKTRENKKIETTLELVEVIKKSMPYKAMKDSHPARKTFQAIRIEVNNELGVLRDALEEAIEMLNVGGRISVITFHSLEDKIVKEIFNKYSKVDSSLSKLPFIPKEYLPKFKLIANITPSKEELEENNRARSSRLRVIERIED